MSKNKVLDVELLEDRKIILHTIDFTTLVSFKEDNCNVVKSRSSQRTDCFVSMDHAIIKRSRRASNYQVKKFLAKWLKDALNRFIKQHKEIDNG